MRGGGLVGVPGVAQQHQRIGDRVDRLGRQAGLDGADRRVRRSARRHRCTLTGTVIDMARHADEGAEIAGLVLGVDHAGRSGTAAAGSRSSCSASASATTSAGAGIVPAVEPDFGARRAPARPACPAAGAACGPASRPSSWRVSTARLADLEAGRLDRRDGRGGIGDTDGGRAGAAAAGPSARPRPGRPCGRSPHRRGNPGRRR